MSSPTRVALAQLEVGTDRAANRAAAVASVDEAARASSHLVVLPEYASAYDRRAVGMHLAEPLDGPFVTAVRERAAATGLAVVVGTSLPSDDPRLAVNAVVAIAGDGELTGVYRKVHLYDAFGARESDVLEPGPPDAAPVVLAVAGLSFGILTCYDLRFPELYRSYMPVDLIFVPSAFTATTGKAHWEMLLRARAIENLAYVIAPAQGGLHANGRETHGHSMVIDPWGEILAEIASGEGIAVAEIDPSRRATLRSSLPALSHRVL